MYNKWKITRLFNGSNLVCYVIEGFDLQCVINEYTSRGYSLYEILSIERVAEEAF